MLRTVLHTAAALALLVVVSPASAEEPVRKAGTHTVRAKAVIGAKVYLSGDATAGIVDDFVMSDEGVVDYLIVSRDGKLVTVPWDAVKFDYERKRATVNVTRDVFEKVPTYSVERYPAFYTPEYRTQIYKAYGMTPGAVRRLERRIERRP